MKNFLIFVAGFIAGIISLLLFAAILSDDSLDIPGLTLFEQPAESLSVRDFEVFQSIDKGAALAREINPSRGWFDTGLLVLLISDDGEYYYDEQVVGVPEGKCMRQVGVYTYTTKSEDRKTIPAVKIMDR